MPQTKPPPPNPHEAPDPRTLGSRGRQGTPPGGFGIEGLNPISRRQTLPVPAGPQPSEATPTRPSGGGLGDYGEKVGAAETVRPPTAAAKQAALRPQLTPHDLGFGVPGPSFGGDTDFDPHEDSPLRRTSSFEKEVAPAARREIRLSEPPVDSLDWNLDDSPLPSFDVPINEALDMVGRNEPPGGSLVPAEPSRRADPLSELRERYALGDFSGALTIAEAILEDEPENGDAQRYAESCRDVLKQMYAARLGPLDQVPIVAVPAEQLRWLTLDHRSGFLLSHVDGVSTLEEILDVSGMPHLEAMRIIYDLLQQKVIVLQ